MTIFDTNGIFSLQDGFVLVMLAEPHECECGRMAMLVVNRDGKTRCVECDEKAVSARARETARRRIA